MMRVKSKLGFIFVLQNDRRASKFAHVFCQPENSTKKPWRALMAKCFNAVFATELEAGEYVAAQLSHSLDDITLPGWDESMRSEVGKKCALEVAEPIPVSGPDPLPEKKIFIPRKMKIIRVARERLGERVFSANDLKTGCSESNADGYNEMYERGSC